MRICQPPENSQQGLCISEIEKPNPCNTVSTRERSFDSSASSSLWVMSPISEIASEYSGKDGSAVAKILSTSASFSRSSITFSNADSTSSKSLREPTTMASCGRYPTVAYFGLAISPASACSMPQRIFSSVLLPAPLEPTSPMRSHLFITALTPSKIARGPYASSMFFNSIIGKSRRQKIFIKARPALLEGTNGTRKPKQKI